MSIKIHTNRGKSWPRLADILFYMNITACTYMYICISRSQISATSSRSHHSRPNSIPINSMRTISGTPWVFHTPLLLHRFQYTETRSYIYSLSLSLFSRCVGPGFQWYTRFFFRVGAVFYERQLVYIIRKN